MLLKIAVRGGIGFRQDQLLALAIASNTTSTTMITTCVPLVITSQGRVAASGMGPGGQAADPSNGAPTTNLVTSQGASPSRGRTEERSS